MNGRGDVLAAGATFPNNHLSIQTVVKLSGARGARLWRQSAADDGEALAVVVDSRGDVVTAGAGGPARKGSDFTVIKRRGNDGREAWRRDIDGTGRSAEGDVIGSFDAANAVVLDAAGDVIAAGTLDNAMTAEDFTVVKFSGGDGTELWRQVIMGSYVDVNGTINVYTGDSAAAVAIDPDGNVVAAGSIGVGSLRSAMAVVKMAGATGDPLWTRNISGTGNNSHGSAMVVDHAGNLVVAGDLGTGGPGSFLGEFTVVKLARADGSELWRQSLPAIKFGGGANAIAVDAGGDIIAAGRADRLDGSGADFTVAKFLGTNGLLLWRATLVTTPASHGTANGVCLGPGFVAAIGYSGGSDAPHYTTPNFTVLRLEPETGIELSRLVLKSLRADGGDERGLALSVDRTGNLYAGGRVDTGHLALRFGVLKLLPLAP